MLLDNFYALTNNSEGDRKQNQLIFFCLFKKSLIIALAFTLSKVFFLTLNFNLHEPSIHNQARQPQKNFLNSCHSPNVVFAVWLCKKAKIYFNYQYLSEW